VEKKMEAQKIMTRHLITVASGTLLESAQLLMKEKRIRHLPVVDPLSSEIIGMLSDRHFMLTKLVSHLVVDSVMTSPVITVLDTTPLRSALFKFLENKVSSILIIDKKNEAVGIITTDDVIWHLAHLLKEEEPQEFSLLSAESKLTIGDLANQLAHTGI
jgi:CBS domain-containing membrane protein